MLEFLSDAAIMMVHASRLAEDWIMYSTEEFGFLELSEKVTTGMRGWLPVTTTPGNTNCLARLHKKLTSIVIVPVNAKNFWCRGITTAQ